MFIFAFLMLLQNSIFVEGGGSIGTSFTDTAIDLGPSFAIYYFPISVKSVGAGVFSSFQWHNSEFTRHPFDVRVAEKDFVAGAALKLNGHVFEPSLRVGVLGFSENIKINIGDEVFLERINTKKTVFVGLGAFIKIWKNLHIDPELSISAVKRPPWHATFRAGWNF